MNLESGGIKQKEKKKTLDCSGSGPLRIEIPVTIIYSCEGIEALHIYDRQGGKTLTIGSICGEVVIIHKTCVRILVIEPASIR